MQISLSDTFIIEKCQMNGNFYSTPERLVETIIISFHLPIYSIVINSHAIKTYHNFQYHSSTSLTEDFLFFFPRNFCICFPSKRQEAI